ncbi:MAG: tRNA (guanosine(37)-N1)-methyltransferase TrmD [Candidatus Dojkabacteria bacterium]
MKISIITAFTEAFSYFNYSIPKRAQEKGKVDINLVNLLDYGLGKWKKIDDKPFGGGAGMVLRIEPLYRALKDLVPNRFLGGQKQGDFIKPKFELPKISSKKDSLILLTSARGEQWHQQYAESYSLNVAHLIIICGHYEGVDNRITAFIDAEVSIGDFVLSGGELGAMVIADSIIRLLEGVVGKKESVERETHFYKYYKDVEHPHYTRPGSFSTDEGLELKVPDILLSGHHAEIENWKKKNTKRIKKKKL